MLFRSPWKNNEKQHRVILTKDFYTGVFEVSQKQWERVTGKWPSYFNNVSYRDARPVECISYDDIRGSGAGARWPEDNRVDPKSFIGRLRAKTGLMFDLPTESQWEYVCRSGTVTALNSSCNLTNSEFDVSMDVVGRYRGNGGNVDTQNGVTSVGTAKVGSYAPNAWGMFDMHGNVYEWCLDYQDIYPDAVTDPNGPSKSRDLSTANFQSLENRVVRGGSWNRFASYCRSAARLSANSDGRCNFIGFRVAAPIEQ